MLVYQRVPHENAVLLEANLNYFDWAYFPVCYVKLPEGSSPHPNWNSMNEYLVVAFFAATKLTQWTEAHRLHRTLELRSLRWGSFPTEAVVSNCPEFWGYTIYKIINYKVYINGVAPLLIIPNCFPQWFVQNVGCKFCQRTILQEGISRQGDGESVAPKNGYTVAPPVMLAGVV
jgi:hypothetical protein